MKSLPFYFDFASPYSYLSWIVLTRRANELKNFGLVLDPKPVMMGSLVTRYVDKGPAQIPPKRDFLFRQALRIACAHGVELNVPPQLLFNPLLALRLALKDVCSDYQPLVIDQLFKALWVDGLQIDDADSVTMLLNKSFDPQLVQEWMIATSGSQARAGLKTNIKMALDDGCFGVPSLIFDNELYWGFESIDFLFKEIAQEKTYSEKQMKKFLDQVSKW